MCDFGITAAVVGTVTGVVSSISSSVMQAQAAQAQNERNRQQQEAIQKEEVAQMQALAMQAQQTQLADEQQREAQQRNEMVALSQSRQASADANVGGGSASRLMRDIRKQRLQGITTANTNLSNFRAQQMLEARGIRATAASRNNSLQWANPGASIASGVLGSVGALSSGLATDIGGGESLGSHIWKKATKK